MLIDIFILLFAISAIFRGREIGFVRQLFSTVGFFAGLFLGAWLEPHTIQFAHSALSRSLVTIVTTLGCALLLLTLGELFGVSLKQKVLVRRINSFDNALGAALGVLTLLVTVWLGASIAASLPFTGVKMALRQSRIVSSLDRHLPSAPTIIADFGHLIDPNGFPQVFIGLEPHIDSDVPLPDLGVLQAAVVADKQSVVKIEGQGCGGIVEGSGFVVGSDLVATNAHVVAGITHPQVEDANGTHTASAIWFDPNLDFAVLRVPNLAGPSLLLASARAPAGTPAAVLGYPGGGGFTAKAAAVRDEFTATGRNIYGNGNTDRDIYEVQADIIPGNSGGPLVAKDGSVIGIVFAQSTTYNHIGYALTLDQVSSELKQAEAQNHVVGTGRCAD